MRIITLGNGTEFFNNMGRCGPVRVPHAEVNDILATSTSGHL
jgi:hypothetical protein